LLEAVSQGNKALFSGISGVGKKTVEKLFVEIREKAEKRLLLERGASSSVTGKKSSLSTTTSVSWTNDLEQALLGLGYKENDVRAAIRELTGYDSSPKDFDTALRSALGFLSGSKGTGLRGTA